MFIGTGTPVYVRPELVKPTGNAALQVRPDVLSGRGVSINMQPLTGLATSVVVDSFAERAVEDFS